MTPSRWGVVSRRLFIGGTGASVVGLALAACSDDDAATTTLSERSIPTDQLFDSLLPPTQFRVSVQGAGRVRVSWIGGCVPTGEPSYRVFVNGSPRTTTATLNATLTQLTPGQQAIAVCTVDQAGTESVRTPESVVTIGATTGGGPQLLPLVLEAIPAASAVQFRWSFEKSYTGARADSFRLRQTDLPRPIAVTIRDTSEPDNWWFATGLTPNVIREFYVEAVDAAGQPLGRSVNSVRVTPYQRMWPRDYPTPNRVNGLRSTTSGASTTIAWAEPKAVDVVNVFADGKFVMQVSGATTQVSLGSDGGSQQRVSVRSVSRWGVSSDIGETVTTSVKSPVRTGFASQNGFIIGPEGAPFVPVGINLSGMDFFWNEGVYDTATVARDVWKMTAVRVDCGFRDWGAVRGAQGYMYFTNNNLDRVVKDFTDAGIVVILSQFNKPVTTSGGLLSPDPESAPDGTGRSVEDGTTDWWIEVARRYRDNPRVWINPINEPRNDPDGLYDQYTRMSTRIRAIAPLTPLVFDAANFANDIPNNASIADGPIREEDSFVLRHGRALFDAFGEPAGFGPVIFSIHAYSRWPRNYATNKLISDSDLADRMRDYVQEVRRRGLPLLVGETGVEDFARESDSATVRVGLYEQGVVAGARTGVWPELQVGVIAWHASPASGMPVARKAWSSVTAVADTSPPPDAGRGIWNYGHQLRP